MTFEKPLMTISELTKMGFSKKLLIKIAQTQGFPVAVREGLGKTAAIKFDTEELYSYLKRTSRMVERR